MARARHAANPEVSRAATRRWKERNPDRARQYYELNRERHAAAGKRWREANPERMRELKTAWIETNRDRRREWQRKYVEENRDQIAATRRAWTERNRDHLREQDRQWRAANPHKTKAANAKRYALTHGIDAEDIDYQEVFESDEWVCQLCGLPVDPEADYPDPLSPSVDHILPFALGGKHIRGNVQTAHLVCNLRKNCDPARVIAPPVA